MIKRNLLLGTFLVAFFSISSAQQSDPVILMTVGDRPVALSEFKDMYYNNLSKDSIKNPASLNNYLKLFIDFRLKVNAAIDARLDTTPSFRQEMGEYRGKLAEPKMRDTIVENQLIREAYERSKFDIRAKHILIKVGLDATPADTLAAYNKIMKIRNKIVKGDTSFDAASKKYSEDAYLKDKGGDLGYFTSMGTVYPFETVAYSSKPGEVSKPVRTQFGYHIIKVLDKRPDIGQIEVAHIMLRPTPKMSLSDSIRLKAKADSIYQLAKQGEDFAGLARKFSQDQSSSQKGGVLRWFCIGQMKQVPEFEKAAFDLKNVGDICAPIRTEYGWHIIKLIAKKPVQPFDSVKETITARIIKDPRFEISINSLVNKTKAKYNYQEYPEAKKEAASLIDDSFFRGKWTADKAKGHTSAMLTIGGTNFTVEDFAAFAAKNQMPGENKGADFAVNMLYPKFVKQCVLKFKNDHLEIEDPKFAAMLNQYRDGILLFDITDQMVWSKALKDTTGLNNFHNMHKGNYMWGERCDATVCTCATKEVAKNAKAMISDGKTDKEILETINGKNGKLISISSGKFEKKDNEMVDANWRMKGVSQDIEKDGKIVFVVVRGTLPPQQKTLDEVRGLATTDYQNYLMEQWLSDLHTKYPVHVNQDVLNQILPKQ